METTSTGTLGFQRPDVLDEFQPVFVRQGNVQQDQVQLELHDGVEGLAGVVGLGADLEVRLVGDQLRQPGAHHGMVIHDEHGAGGVSILPAMESAGEWCAVGWAEMDAR